MGLKLSKRMKSTQIILLLLLVSVCFIGFLHAEEVCKFTYLGIPENLDNDTIILPIDSHVVAMSEYIHVGTPIDTLLDRQKNSIFFIIDNSGSMQSIGGNDASGSRFNVSRDLIDTIYNINPKMQVGLVIFGTHLFFDPNDDNIFDTCPQYDTGAFIPLLRLDSTYGSLTGYEILKHYLETDTVGTVPNQWVDLAYNPTNTTLSLPLTNITASFEAAKHGMSFSIYPPERHFNIFLSDGLETAGGPNYIQGTNVPTTFTVFFTSDTTAPPSLQNMTTNIIANGYSTSNPLSDLWAIKTDYDTLMNLLMENVIGKMIDLSETSTPVKLKVNITDSSTTWDGTGFIFDKLFELLGITTDFNFIISYEVYKDSITPGGDTIQILVKETTDTVDFTVKLEDNAPVPDSIDLTWWGRNLEFYHSDSIVGQVGETMDTLEIRFTEYKVDTTYGYENVPIIITHSEGSTQDAETFILQDMGSYHSIKFPRTVGAPVPGDGILQHQSPDDIIAIFRNPDLKLDTLRSSIHYGLIGIYFDNDANGYIDSISILIHGMKAGENVDGIMKAITLPDFRDFGLTGYSAFNGGIGVKVEEGKTFMPRTYVSDEDILILTDTVILDQGIILVPSTIPIIDSVAPVINKANLIDSLNISGRDELTIEFSEDVEAITHDMPFKFFRIAGAIVYDVVLSVISQNGNIGVFEVDSVIGLESIIDGDSIRINWTYTDNNVYDSIGNNQDNPNNVRREINVTEIGVILDIEKVIYFDKNAEGFVDSIFIGVTGDLIEENTDGLMGVITFPEYRAFEILSHKYVNGGIAVFVDEKAPTPTTYVTPEDVLIVKSAVLPQGGLTSADTIPIIDSIAPIIHWADSSAFLIDHQDPAVTDTLIVKFSEPVKKVEHIAPFYFSDSSNNYAVYTVDLDTLIHNSDIVQFKVVMINDNVDYMQNGDSIWIHEGNRISDGQSNYQNNTRNIHRRLVVKRRLKIVDLTPQVISPLNISDLNNVNAVSQDIVNILDPLNKKDLELSGNVINGKFVGMVIQLVPDNFEILPDDYLLEGEITIFDAVGNHLILNRTMGFYEKTKSLIYLWNGRNSYGRSVGSGAYLAVIISVEITPSLLAEGMEGKKREKRIFLGIETE